jgi:hypothetical protein
MMVSLIWGCEPLAVEVNHNSFYTQIKKINHVLFGLGGGAAQTGQHITFFCYRKFSEKTTYAEPITPLIIVTKACQRANKPGLNSSKTFLNEDKALSYSNLL